MALGAAGFTSLGVNHLDIWFFTTRGGKSETHSCMIRNVLLGKRVVPEISTHHVDAAWTHLAFLLLVVALNCKTPWNASSMHAGLYRYIRDIDSLILTLHMVHHSVIWDSPWLNNLLSKLSRH